MPSTQNTGGREKVVGAERAVTKYPDEGTWAARSRHYPEVIPTYDVAAQFGLGHDCIEDAYEQLLELAEQDASLVGLVCKVAEAHALVAEVLSEIDERTGAEAKALGIDPDDLF